MRMASTRAGGGVQWHSDGVQVLACLIMALLFISSMIDDVHCSITTDTPAPPPQAPTPNFTTFDQFEADALNAILKNWTTLNPQLSTLLNWSPTKHPCDNLTYAFAFNTYGGGGFNGAWLGVRCIVELQVANTTGNYYQAYVAALDLHGSNSSCGGNYAVQQCGFDGIHGELPPEVSNLIKMGGLYISNNPKLTGLVPIEIFQMPNLASLDLSSNSLEGTLPSDIYNAGSMLFWMDLSHNNFSGSLGVSSQGTIFSSALTHLDVSFNKLDGPIDIQRLNSSGTYELTFGTLNLSNNHFNGTFSTTPYFNVEDLVLSNNDFTTIQFTKYNESNIYSPSLLHLNISNNKFTEPFPTQTLQMPSLTNLDLSMNNFFGSIDFQSGNETTRLDFLNISNNNFSGTLFTGSNLNPGTMDFSNNYFENITFDIFNGTTVHVNNAYMPSLLKLYFQNNKLRGEFPIQILTTTSLQILDGSQNQYETLKLPDIQFENSSISKLDLTNNKFGDVQYSNKGPFTSYNLQFSSLLFLGNNPMCNKIESVLLSTICRFNRSSPILNVIQESNTKNKVIIATSTSLAFVCILFTSTVYIWRLTGRIKALRIVLKEFEKKEVKPNLYSYKEIKLATNNFGKNNKLGEGGFGVVYKGELIDGTIVAVKKLTVSSHQVLPEFLNEVVVISGLKHRNLVKLKGCCLGDGDQRMLVFEYVENKNLGEALWMHGDLESNIESPCLDWETRFNIIVGIARGLAYLHEELQPPIIHRDIKPTNILLDKNYNPKIADFGLAYLFPTLNDKASHLTLMEVAGTRGYFSPEYALHGHVSTALDVYSFGIVVLEIVSGRKSVDFHKSSEEVCLREWAWKHYQAQTSMTLVDSKMKHSPIDLEAMMRVVNVALACVHYKAARRPKMHNVVSMLFGNVSINEFETEFEYGEVVLTEATSMTFDTCTSSLHNNEN